MLDGKTYYTDTWAHGLAFTGGRSGYVQPCGLRQATINFGTVQTYGQTRVWFHGDDHIPTTYRLENWDGTQWQEIAASSTVRWDLRMPPSGTQSPYWEAVPIEHTFAPVHGSKVRFVLNNCNITHGWIYEFEVFGGQKVPPSADAGGPYTVNEGASITLDASKSFDVDGGSIVSYGWDLDGDGVFEAAGKQVTFSAANRSGPASQPVTLRVYDNDNLYDDAQTTVAIANVAPAPDAGPDQTVYVNDSVTVIGTWFDPATYLDNDYTWRWYLGDVLEGSGSAAYGAQIAHTTSLVVPGTATLSFEVTDKDGDVAIDTVKVAVLNNAPVAAHQDVSTDEDTPLAVTLTAGDADNDSLTYTLVKLPEHGSLEGTTPDLKYTPAANYNGTDSFTFQANDGIADSNIATVAITIVPVNDPPVVLADSDKTDEDVAVSIPVLANDSAGPNDENQALTVSAVSEPPRGTATASADGTITYTPDLDANGEDSFTYSACDSDGACISAQVTVLVAMVNDPPAAAADSAATAEDTPVQIDVAANDSDPDGNLDRSSAALVSSPTNGSAAILDNGLFAYTPAADFNGEDSFAYQICDSYDVCSTAFVLITVAPVNDAPVCTAAIPSIDTLWPADHRAVPVEIIGATDVEGDPTTIAITSIFQDEPTNGLGDGDSSPDGAGIGTSTAQLRAERSGKGNGRYYHIGFSATDANGGACSGEVMVGVPKSQGSKGAPVDDGASYDSTMR